MKFDTVAVILVFTFGVGSVQAAHELENRDIAMGQVLYGAQCSSCHGVDLEGQANWQTPDENGVLPAPPHDESGHTWHHGAELLFSYTKLGGEKALEARGVSGFSSGMPGFGDRLSDDEIWDILAYIRSTWSPRIQNNQTLRTRPHD